MRVAVIGGGIIGLASAWRLADAGVDVVLFDAAPEAREASWAAAGMLAPHHEHNQDTPLWRLCVKSQERWPAFINELGTSPEHMDFRTEDGLVPLLDIEDEREAETKHEFLRAAGISCQRITGADLRRIEPALAPTIDSALVIPAAQVNPRLITAALRDACDRAGVRLRYADAVIRIAGTTVDTATASQDFDHIVLASGAWTPALAALANVPLRGEPVKGQLLRFATDDNLMTRFIHCRHVYLVPRRGQGMVVGATMIQAGFDKAEDPRAVAKLAAAAHSLIPRLKDAAIAETWTGLRPRLAHGLPVLATVRPGLTIATGHFRNGILLTPITAEIVSSLVQGRNPPCDLAPFRLPA
jgi:glycine oxidase